MPLDTWGHDHLQVPTWLLKSFWVAERSIGNRTQPTWTAIKVQSITMRL